MPIVRVEMFRGRTTVMKEFLGRAIVDAVSEIAGPPRENVQVLFSDVGTDEWAIGPTLVANRPAAPAPHTCRPLSSPNAWSSKPARAPSTWPGGATPCSRSWPYSPVSCPRRC